MGHPCGTKSAKQARDAKLRDGPGLTFPYDKVLWWSVARHVARVWVCGVRHMWGVQRDISHIPPGAWRVSRLVRAAWLLPRAARRVPPDACRLAWAAWRVPLGGCRLARAAWRVPRCLYAGLKRASRCCWRFPLLRSTFSLGS